MNRFDLSPENTNQDGAILVFTLGMLSVGVVSYLYMKTISALYEMKAESTGLLTTLQDLNENMNTMFLRIETLASKDEIENKADINPDNDIDYDNHQAWQGTCRDDETNSNVLVEIVLVKPETVGSNREWESWSSEKDPSMKVRDYYVETFDSDYSWKITSDEETVGFLYETMVNDWRSVVQVKILVRTHADNQKANNDFFTGVFKRCQNPDVFNWKRVLVHAC